MSDTCCNPEAETELERDSAIVSQDTPTHYGNGLRKLCDPETVHNHFADIMENVCQYDFNCEYPPVPERHAFLQSLPIARAVKRDALKNNPCLKRRSTHGYIWVDHDPMAILANKYIIRSCHLLDNTEHEYRSGNFNHVYNPYMVTLFAGRENPSVEVQAVSPETGDTLYVGVMAQKIRKHQATCNLFLLSDEDGKPYLYVSRLYDSCDEVGWGWAVARYCRVYAKRLGIGVCFDSTWGAREALRPGAEVGSYGAFPENIPRLYFTSPAYDHPTAPERFPGYHDGSLQTYSIVDAALIASNATAYKVIEPTTDERLEKVTLCSHANTARPKSGCVCCYSCGRAIWQSDVCTYDGDSYCEDCFIEEFSTCESCDEAVREVHELGVHYYCDSCYSERVTRCERCGDNVPNEDSIGIDYNDYCSSCVEDYGRTCERCDEQLIEYQRGIYSRVTVGNVVWHTPVDGDHSVPMCECCDADATRDEEEAIQRAQEAETELRETLGLVDARPAPQAEVLPLYAGHLDHLANCAIIAARYAATTQEVINA